MRRLHAGWPTSAESLRYPRRRGTLAPRSGGCGEEIAAHTEPRDEEDGGGGNCDAGEEGFLRSKEMCLASLLFFAYPALVHHASNVTWVHL